MNALRGGEKAEGTPPLSGLEILLMNTLSRVLKFSGSFYCLSRAAQLLLSTPNRHCKRPRNGHAAVSFFPTGCESKGGWGSWTSMWCHQWCDSRRKPCLSRFAFIKHFRRQLWHMHSLRNQYVYIPHSKQRSLIVQLSRSWKFRCVAPWRNCFSSWVDKQIAAIMDSKPPMTKPFACTTKLPKLAKRKRQLDWSLRLSLWTERSFW